MAITILDLAIYRGAKPDERGSYSGDELARVGLPILAGCEVCGAVLGAYNAAPSVSGYTRCADSCIGGAGWETVEEANRDIFDGHQPPEPPACV